jgi:hypothetical protein
MSDTLSASGRYCGDFTVGRIEMPSVAAFNRDYARIGKPVIITNLLEKTRAAKKWTPDYLIKTVGAQQITITKLRNGKLRSNNARYAVPFADYAARAFANDPQARRYCAQQIKMPEPIARDFPTPGLVGSWLRVQPHFWLSTPGHITETHRDANHNLLAQVIGKKKLTLFSPVFAHALYSHHPRSRLSRYSRLDMDHPDFHRFPQARELTPTEVTLNAGEALFLPVYWWHRVQTLEPSVSVNFWWAPPLGLSLTPQVMASAVPDELFRAVHALADLSSFASEYDVVQYLWDQGFRVLAVAYLHHCLAVLRDVNRHNGVNGGALRSLRSIRKSCRPAVKLIASVRRSSALHGIPDITPLLAAARELTRTLKCDHYFRPSRWVPPRPFDD